jgi:hypothetical protein
MRDVQLNGHEAAGRNAGDGYIARLHAEPRQGVGAVGFDAHEKREKRKSMSHRSDRAKIRLDETAQEAQALRSYIASWPRFFFLLDRTEPRSRSGSTGI